MSLRLLAPLLAFALSAALLRGLLTPAARAWFLDQPNQRSLHVTPVPRTGGLAIVPAALLGMLLGSGRLLPIGLALGLMLLSVIDDWKPLPAGVRLLGHLLAAAALVGLAVHGVGLPGAVVLVVAVGWMTNLYNFMDGADGLAGGMAVFGFGAYGAAAWIGGDPSFALASLSIAAAALAFLMFNFPPARIFMGDAGSVPLGFLAAALGVTGWRAGLWPVWFPLVVFAPFIADATVTLLRRAARGEKVWQAHRSHYYQRRVLMGWTHRRLALAEYTLMALSGLAALGVLTAPPLLQAAALVAVALVYGAIAYAIDVRWRETRAAGDIRV